MANDNYREQAERCLRLARGCTDVQVADMLRGLAADYLEQAVKGEMAPVTVPSVVQQVHQMQQSRAKNGEADKN